MKQRLGIAIALVNDPEVVFLDEPTTGLDPRARREVWEVLLGLKKKGKTVFLTTHYMEEAELLADTVAIISKGKIIAMGSPDELIRAQREVPGPHAEVRRRDSPSRSSGGWASSRSRTTTRTSRSGWSTRDDVRKILNALKDAGASFLSLDVRKPNLEAVFLKLTGEALREGPPRRVPE